MRPLSNRRALELAAQAIKERRPEDLESGAAMQNIMSLVEQQPRTVLEKMRIHLNAHVSKVLWNWKPQHVAKQVLERAYVTTQE